MSVNCPGGQVYVIRRGDTLFSLARRFSTTVSRIIAANPGIDPNNLRVGQRLCIPVPGPVCPGGVTYTIAAGDTLFTIARRYNASVDAIIAANPGINPENLRVGQVICIPQEAVPVPRPRCVVLNPTDLMPNSKAAVFVEPGINSVLGIVTNVPDPTVLPGGEVYKLWVKTPTVSHWAVTTMREFTPGYWIGRVLTGFPLTGADVIISAERAANTTAPAGIGVAVGTI